MFCVIKYCLILVIIFFGDESFDVWLDCFLGFYFVWFLVCLLYVVVDELLIVWFWGCLLGVELFMVVLLFIFFEEVDVFLVFLLVVIFIFMLKLGFFV